MSQRANNEMGSVTFLPAAPTDTHCGVTGLVAVGYAMFIGLNPSTADEVQDDPTVRRCINFSKEWGFSALCMTNIFGYRATDLRDMKAVDDPVGPGNDEMLIEVAKNAGVIVAAWGTHGVHNRREEKVKQMLGDKLMCLRLTKAGHPAHPLYLPKTLKPFQLITERHL